MHLEQELIRLLDGKTAVIGKTVRWAEEMDSTNLECRRLAAQGEPEGTVILARAQSAGRGRRGRSFQSTKDLGLYLSVLLRPTQDMQTLSNMTAWVAVAVCDGIARACGVRPQIKWINDIILNGKKLGGILTELGLEQGSVDHLVVGIGINAAHTLTDFEEELPGIVYGMDIFSRRGRLWERDSEEHIEYAYEPEYLEELLRSRGFVDVKLHHDCPQGDKGRLFISAKRKEN